MAVTRLVFGDGTQFLLTRKEVIVGREPTNDLMLDDPHLSRHHARFDLIDERWMLDDMGSTLGTTLNGAPVRVPTGLNHGDVIVFGRTIEARFLND
ncbi:MAG: FHA domain-containing protein [Anaerolineaceae bacterium]